MPLILQYNSGEANNGPLARMTLIRKAAFATIVHTRALVPGKVIGNTDAMEDARGDSNEDEGHAVDGIGGKGVNGNEDWNDDDNGQ